MKTVMWYFWGVLIMGYIYSNNITSEKEFELLHSWDKYKCEKVEE